MNSRTTAAGLLAGCILSTTAVAGDTGDAAVVHEWNDLVLATAPANAGPLTGRFAALVHLAQFEAVNSIQGRYTPYLGTVAVSNGASTRAAAAQAAHDVLVAIVPARKDTYDAALADDLADIPSGLAMQGVAAGKAAAQQVVAWASTDGFSTPDTPFSLPLQAGAWRPVPAPPAFTRTLNMRPMALASRSQFLPKRFPELNTHEYAVGVNEVKAYGAKTGSLRSPAQTQLAQLWATLITQTSQFSAWNQVARKASTARGLDLLDTARVLAFLNVGLFDGLLTTQSSKYVFGLWRPQTAIQNAADDFNDETIADGAWTAFVPIPPYPSYPGNVACIGAVAARSLQLSFGTDAVSFDLVWKGNTVNGVTNPDVTQHYDSLWAMAQDGADARIYGGLHYRFDNEASQQICPKIAEWIHARYMRARGE